MSGRPGRGNRTNNLRALDGGKSDVSIDVAQMAAMRAQMEGQQQQIQFNQHMQNQSLMTQQSALALDAAKYIIDHRDDGYCMNPAEVRENGAPPQMLMFSMDEVHNAYDTIATIAVVFRPQVQPPQVQPPPVADASDGTLPEHKSAAPDITADETIPEGMARS
jgi:hypothetical protein